MVNVCEVVNQIEDEVYRKYSIQKNNILINLFYLDYLINEYCFVFQSFDLFYCFCLKRFEDLLVELVS